MKETEKIDSEQAKTELRNYNKYNTEVVGQSPVYMLIFYSIVALIFVAMTFHFLTLQKMMISFEHVDLDFVITTNDNIPYNKLIIALILYCLGMFGIDGTRSLIMSMDINSLSEKAKNMPAYKRRRLLQMIISFIALSIMAMVYQIMCADCGKANFQCDSLFAGIAVFMSLLAYSDFGPKLGKQISTAIQHKKEQECECEEEITKKRTRKKKEKEE